MKRFVLGFAIPFLIGFPLPGLGGEKNPGSSSGEMTGLSGKAEDGKFFTDEIYQLDAVCAAE